MKAILVSAYNQELYPNACFVLPISREVLDLIQYVDNYNRRKQQDSGKYMLHVRYNYCGLGYFYEEYPPSLDGQDLGDGVVVEIDPNEFQSQQEIRVDMLVVDVRENQVTFVGFLKYADPPSSIDTNHIHVDLLKELVS